MEQYRSFMDEYQKAENDEIKPQDECISDLDDEEKDHFLAITGR